MWERLLVALDVAHGGLAGAELHDLADTAGDWGCAALESADAAGDGRGTSLEGADTTGDGRGTALKGAHTAGDGRGAALQSADTASNWRSTAHFDCWLFSWEAESDVSVSWVARVYSCWLTLT